MSINLDLYDDLEVLVNGSGSLDPNKIRISVWTPTVDVVLKMLGDGSLDLSSDFDRSAFWNEKAASRLVESLLIKIPLPAFYVDGTREDHLLVVDGIQRLRALKGFMRDEAYALSGLEYLKEFEGKTFGELKRPLQRRLEESSLTIHRIEAGTSEGAKRNIIRRIHSAAKALSAQEIRMLLQPGPGAELLKLLARHEDLRTIFGPEKEGMPVEEVLLFFLLGPNKALHEENLRDYLQHLNDDTAFREMQSSRFLQVFHRARKILSEHPPEKALARSKFLAFLFAIERDPDSGSLSKEYL